jgi:outer membrane protein assembly factor BamB
MGRLNRGIILAAGLTTVVGVSSVFSQDWPQWRGPNRDGKVAGFKAPQTWPKELTQKWKVSVGLGDATPALKGDRLYAFGRLDANEVITCLDAATGKTVWQDRYPAEYVVTGPAVRHGGPRSSPAVAEGKVLTLGVGGILSCLDAGTGKVLWRKQSVQDYGGTEYRFDSSMSPLVADGRCVVYLGGKGKGTIMALDFAGQVQWKYEGDAPASSSPVVMTVNGVRQVVTLSEKQVIAVGLADGKLLWQSPFQAKQGNNTTPVVDDQTVVVMGQGMPTSALKIERQDGQFAARRIWDHNDLQVAPRFTTPVLKDGLLFGLAGGKLYCLNAKTGVTCWIDTASRGNSGAIVDAGPCLMALTLNMELAVYQASDKQYTELAHYKVADTETWAHPVVSATGIYVRDQNTVALWTF